MQLLQRICVECGVNSVSSACTLPYKTVVAVVNGIHVN